MERQGAFELKVDEYKQFKGLERENLRDRNFELVINKACTACFNSGQRIDDHFVDITEMVEIGSGTKRENKTVLLPRYVSLPIPLHQSLQNPRIYFPFPRWRRLINRGPFTDLRFRTFKGD